MIGYFSRFKDATREYVRKSRYEVGATVDYINRLRLEELKRVVRFMPSGSRILEIGGGTGQQAAMLESLGYSVAVIELPASYYAQAFLYPVIEYDGRTIPFRDDTFDIVYSSNVLEHVPDLENLHREIRRVLKPDGRCLHVLPTSCWRLWTTIAQVPNAAKMTALTGKDILLRPWSGHTERASIGVAWLRLARSVATFFYQRRHGERGNIISEHWLFHPNWWRRNFRGNGFVIACDEPVGIFYTGAILFGPLWSFPSRERWAHRLGSACHVFDLRLSLPKNCSNRTKSVPGK